MKNIIPEQASHVHSDAERNHKSHANKPQTRCESKTTEPDRLIDFPEINSITPLSDVATGNLQLKTQHNDKETCDRKITHNSRRYSDVHSLNIRVSPLLTAAPRRRNSSPTFRAVSQGNNNDDGNETSEPKMPENTPCCPDLKTCCQNVATFLANAAATSNTKSKNLASAEHIYSYMRFLFAVLQLEPECCVYADIYVRRFVSNAQDTFQIHSGNWHKLLVGACLLASKYVDDLSMNNRDFATALAGCSLQLMNKLEASFLKMMNWRLHVPISEYTTRYFELASKQDVVRDWDANLQSVKSYFNVKFEDFNVIITN